VTRLLSAAAPADIEAVAALLQDGGIAALPTETVYGLAGDALNPTAVQAIYAAKGRPADNPLIVHIAGPDDLSALARKIPSAARLLAERFWPGPLSIVFPRQPHVPDVVTAGLDTVAVRVPAHPAFLDVLRAGGRPLAAPSANRAGSPSSTTAAHVLHDLDGLIPAVLDGGPCTVGVESTVIDLTNKPCLLRPGGVPLEALREVLGEIAVHPAVSGELAANAQPGAPGMKYRHYSPTANVIVVDGDVQHAAEYLGWVGTGESAVLCPAEEAACFSGQRVVTYGSLTDPATLARGLFDALRTLDTPDVTHIYARCPLDETGISRAVRNRLLKAAAFQTVTV